jgi:hypothetical protein
VGQEIKPGPRLGALDHVYLGSGRRHSTSLMFFSSMEQVKWHVHQTQSALQGSRVVNRRREKHAIVLKWTIQLCLIVLEATSVLECTCI